MFAEDPQWNIHERGFQGFLSRVFFQKYIWGSTKAVNKLHSNKQMVHIKQICMGFPLQARYIINRAVKSHRRCIKNALTHQWGPNTLILFTEFSISQTLNVSKSYLLCKAIYINLSTKSNIVKIPLLGKWNLLCGDLVRVLASNNVCTENYGCAILWGNFLNAV